MISETAFFVKDVFGPKGSVSIVAKEAGAAGKSSSIEAHTKTESLRFHHADLDKNEKFSKPDTLATPTSWATALAPGRLL
jgi:hypothetical protein